MARNTGATEISELTKDDILFKAMWEYAHASDKELSNTVLHPVPYDRTISETHLESTKDNIKIVMDMKIAYRGEYE